jgi:transposase
MQPNFNILKRDFVDLLGINEELLSFDGHKFNNDYLYIYVSKERETVQCPVCGDSTDTVHDYYTRTIKHGVFNNRKCIIRFKQRRYACDCGKRFSVRNAFVEKFNKISVNVKKSLFKEAIPVSSYKDIAKRLFISPTTVRRIFMSNCKQKRKPLPRVLSIDEFKGNSGAFKYNVSLCDPSNKEIIDIVPCRHKDVLDAYFCSLPASEMAKVKVITMDMWHTYYDIAKKHFPWATIVIDTFHFVRLVTNAANNTRIRIMKKILKDKTKGSKEYKTLKHNWKLFLKKPSLISNEIKFNKYHKEYTSEAITLDYMMNIHPELTSARELLESFYEIIHNAKYPDAYNSLSKWITKSYNSFIGEFREAASSIHNWLPEISNSFMINPDTNSKYSNAFIEGMNNFIKVIKRVSYGLPNFGSLRNKVLYHHNNSAHKLTADCT